MTQATRKTAPEPLAPIAFNTPAPYSTKLANGLRIVIFEDMRLPLVSYRLAFFSGDANEPAEVEGISSATAAMLSEGTRNFSSRELAEKIERLGSSISASSSDDFTMVAASSLSLYNSELLDMIAEIVLLPSFPESELDLYRRNTIEHLKFQRSQPGFLAGEQTARILYGEHPYAKTSPSQDDVEKLTRDALVDFHSRTYLPNNAIMIVVGDVDLEEAVANIDKRFKRWQPGEVSESSFPGLPVAAERTLTIVDRPGSAQSNIVLANIAIDRKNPDYFPFLVMNQVLGAGASSRVFMNLREEKGYTYGAYTRFDAKRFGGDFEATAEVRTAVTGDSLKEFFYELNRIRDEAVSEQELTDAKNFLVGVFPIRAETQEGLTNLIVSQYLHGLPEDYLQTYRDNIRAVTPDDVKRVAEKYVQPEKMAVVIVGDASEILPQAESYSKKIEIFDTNNNRLDPIIYAVASDGQPADVSGSWELSIDFQGQQIPVSLSLIQTGDTANGSLETMLGTGEISGGKVKGNKLSAAARTEIQGETVEFLISGTITGDSMSGTLSAPIVPEPLAFTGSRSK
ncbi:MAG TPA: pitrilysin family protein [Pyrinomonadaceae bacterium]|nr:pitrilysin family protein [Pyrinomonadaceae bacterium]